MNRTVLEQSFTRIVDDLMGLIDILQSGRTIDVAQFRGALKTLGADMDTYEAAMKAEWERETLKRTGGTNAMSKAEPDHPGAGVPATPDSCASADVSR